MSQIRINKYIADAGICSRRKADTLIENKQVFINGKTAKPGDKVTTKDKVTVNGQTIQSSQNSGVEKIYIAFNKPFGVITTTDPKSENNILDYIKLHTRLFPIGRLDVYTTGLLLITNDGELSNTLTKSKNKIEKVYLLAVQTPFKETDLKKMGKGMKIQIPRRNSGIRTPDGTPTLYTTRTLPAKIKRLTANKIELTIVQGLNRQIRRMCDTLHYKVQDLKRIRFANIELGTLKPGEWRYLNKEEVAQLKKEGSN